MLRFGVRVLSGRVPTRHTAFHNSSLGGRHTCSSTAIGMCGLLGCSLRSLPALVPTWCTRNTSTGRGSSLRKEVFLLCWFCFMPTRQMDFVRSSFVVLTCPMGLGPCIGCSTYVLIQPHLSVFTVDSRDVAYQPLVRCVGFAVNTHSVADSLPNSLPKPGIPVFIEDWWRGDKTELGYEHSPFACVLVPFISDGMLLSGSRVS